MLATLADVRDVLLLRLPRRHKLFQLQGHFTIFLFIKRNIRHGGEAKDASTDRVCFV